jgi:hypothetical protein
MDEAGVFRIGRLVSVHLHLSPSKLQQLAMLHFIYIFMVLCDFQTDIRRFSILLLGSEQSEAHHGSEILEINMKALAGIAVPRKSVAEACRQRTYPHVLPRHFSFNFFFSTTPILYLRL